MAIVSTSSAWVATYREVPFNTSIDSVDYDLAPDVTESFAGSLAGAPSPDTGSSDTAYAARFTSTFTNDANDTLEFYLGVVGQAVIKVDGVEVMRLDSANVDGAALGPCAATAATTCLCKATEPYAIDDVSLDLGPGEHTIEVTFVEHPVSNGLSLDWAVNDLGRRPMDLTLPEAADGFDQEGDGEWGDVFDLPVIPIHTIVTPDGKVFMFGAETNVAAGDASFYTLHYGVFDPETGEYVKLPNEFGSDIVCAQLAIDPTTGNVLILGGDTRGVDGVAPALGIDEVHVYNYQTMEITPAEQGNMIYERWYPSALTLNTGEILVMGGRDSQARPVGVAEIFNAETGYRALTGAEIADMSNSGSYWYPHMWQRADGKVVVIEANGRDIYIMDVTGAGSVEKVGAVQFASSQVDPSIMYAQDQVLMVDLDGGLWTADISTDAPVFTKVNDLPEGRSNGNFTLLADGSVIITGGTDNIASEFFGTGDDMAALAGAQYSAFRWIPDTNKLIDLADEQIARLYHSTGTVLPDGTIMSAGGGAHGPLENLNGQILTPDILFDETGALAQRPEILNHDKNIDGGESFTLTVSNAYDLKQVTGIKVGGTTHARNSDSRWVDLEFTVVDASTVVVEAPEANIFIPGLWMISAINTDGVPSEYALMGVDMAPIYDTDPILVTEGLNGAPLYQVGYEFEAVATARFDDLGAGNWQRIFDYNNGQGQNNILLGQQAGTNNMRFEIYQNGQVYGVTAVGAIVEGEVAEWRATVSSEGFMGIYKNGVVLAEARGVVPADIERANKMVGESPWPQDTDLVGEVLSIVVNETGSVGALGPQPEPPVDPTAPVELLVNGDFSDLASAPSAGDPFPDPAGWTVIENGFEQVQVDAGVLVFGGGGTATGGAIEQSVNGVAVGGQVELGFNLGVNGNGTGGTVDVRVRITDKDGAIVHLETVTGPQRYEYSFVAADDSYTLRITDVSTGDMAGMDAALDNITLTSAPSEGSVDPVDPVDPPDPIDPVDPVEPPEPALVFEAEATARFDDLGAGQWQRVFDYGDGPASNNILMGQRALSNDMNFEVYQDGVNYKLTAAGAIIEGETANWRATIDADGTMAIYKNGTLLADGPGVVPANVSRPDKLVGLSAWAQDADLVGEVSAIRVNETGPLDPIDPPEDPPVDLPGDPAPVERLVNGALESSVADNTWTPDGDVTGWRNDTGGIEAWAGGFLGVDARDGRSFVELDAGDGLDNLYQDVLTGAGDTFDFSFAARQRGNDTDAIEIYWRGELVDTVTPDGSDAWSEYAYQLEGSGGTDRLEFRELASENDRTGPLIDAISLIGPDVDDPLI